MKIGVTESVLVAELDSPRRCLSSAVLGGGLGEVRSWVNAQVPPDYARMDPGAHLGEISHRLAVPGPVVGMLTAALVEDYVEAVCGTARVVATVGVRDPLAAASADPNGPFRVGTINVLVVVDAPLTDAALVGAACTAVEAKVQALGDAGLRDGGGRAATGTATDSLCVACSAGASVAFAGPATRVGADLARAVYEAVFRGAWRYERWRRENG